MGSYEPGDRGLQGEWFPFRIPHQALVNYSLSIENPDEFTDV